MIICCGPFVSKDNFFTVFEMLENIEISGSLPLVTQS